MQYQYLHMVAPSPEICAIYSIHDAYYRKFVDNINNNTLLPNLSLCNFDIMTGMCIIGISKYINPTLYTIRHENQKHSISLSAYVVRRFTFIQSENVSCCR
jgi:hypothetical protein